MDKDHIKDLIDQLRQLQTTIAETYLENTLMLTEYGAPKEAFELLDRECEELMIATDLRILRFENMLAEA